MSLSLTLCTLVFIIAWLVFFSLYCLTSLRIGLRLLLTTALALLTTSHLFLLYLGDNYDITIYPVFFYITTYLVNLTAFCLPLALIIALILISRRSYKQLRFLFWHHNKGQHQTKGTTTANKSSPHLSLRQRLSSVASTVKAIPDALSANIARFYTSKLWRKPYSLALGAYGLDNEADFGNSFADAALAPVLVANHKHNQTATSSDTKATASFNDNAHSSASTFNSTAVTTDKSSAADSAAAGTQGTANVRVLATVKAAASNVSQALHLTSRAKDNGKVKGLSGTMSGSFVQEQVAHANKNADKPQPHSVTSAYGAHSLAEQEAQELNAELLTEITLQDKQRLERRMRTHKKGLPYWADGDNYVEFRLKLSQLPPEESYSVSWSSGNGNHIIFTDSNGQRSVVDTSIYDRLEYRHRHKGGALYHKHEAVQANALSDFGDAWMEASSIHEKEQESSAEEEEELIEREAQAVYAAAHHGHSTMQDTLAAQLLEETKSLGKGYHYDGEYIPIAIPDEIDQPNQGGDYGYRLADGAVHTKAWYHRLSLKELTKQVGAICFFVLVVVSGYSSFQALSLPSVNTVVVSLDVPEKFDGITIVMLSDLNIGAYNPQARLTNIVRKVTQLHPDMIVVTGNLTTSSLELARPRLHPLFRLAAPLGVYIVVGEEISHYILDSFLDIYKSQNFMFLTNETTDVHFGDQNMCIAGIANKVENAHLLDPANEKLVATLSSPEFTEADFSLLLSNSAAFSRKYQDIAGHNINLMLTGNTLGNAGHVIGTVLGVKHFTYYPGMYRFSDTMEMYVSSGTNIWPFLPIRLTSKGEITQLLIHSSRLYHEPHLPGQALHVY